MIVHILLISLGCVSLLATDQVGIRLDEITVKSNKLKVSATVNLEKGKLTGVQVTLDGKAYKIPKEELKGIADVNPHSIRLLTVGTGGPTEPTAPKFLLVLTLDFGPIVDHVKKGQGRVVEVSSRARFEFWDGKYECRYTAIPEPQDKNVWKLFIKGLGTPVEDDGLVRGAENPYK